MCHQMEGHLLAARGVYCPIATVMSIMKNGGFNPQPGEYLLHTTHNSIVTNLALLFGRSDIRISESNIRELLSIIIISVLQDMHGSKPILTDCFGEPYKDLISNT